MAINQDRNRPDSFGDWLCENGVMVGFVGLVAFWFVIAIIFVETL